MPADTTQSNAPEIDGEEILAGILDWVEEETPSHDGAAVNRLADQVQAVYQALGTVIERTPGRDGFGDILRIRTPGRDSLAPGLLVLSHMDTVHPHDTKQEALVVRREGDVMYGPGIYDMKSGAYLPYYAYRHMLRVGAQPRLDLGRGPQGEVCPGHRTGSGRRQGGNRAQGGGAFHPLDHRPAEPCWGQPSRRSQCDPRDGPPGPRYRGDDRL